MIRLVFLSETGAVLGEVDCPAKNLSDRWELVGDRAIIPVGTRKVTFEFDTVKKSGNTNDAYLDHAFLYLLTDAQGPDQGAYGNIAKTPDMTTPGLALRFPDLYTDWDMNVPHTIHWDSYNNSGDSPVRIDLYQDGPSGPTLVTTIAASTADTGTYVWIPANSGIQTGTIGLHIEISLVNDAGV